MTATKLTQFQIVQTFIKLNEGVAFTNVELNDYVLSNHPIWLQRKLSKGSNESDALAQVQREVISYTSHLNSGNRVMQGWTNTTEKHSQTVFYTFTQTAKAPKVYIPVSVKELTERDSIEREGLAGLTLISRQCYKAYWALSTSFKELTGFGFDVDHAQSIKEHGLSAIKPSNLQILPQRTNRVKSSHSELRQSWSEQERMLRAVFAVYGTEQEAFEASLHEYKVLFNLFS